MALIIVGCILHCKIFILEDLFFGNRVEEMFKEIKLIISTTSDGSPGTSLVASDSCTNQKN